MSKAAAGMAASKCCSCQFMVRIKCPMLRAFYCWHKIGKDSRKHITENE